MKNDSLGFTVLAACILLLLTACGGSSNASDQSLQHVQITETDFHIASNVTMFQPEVHYQFTITNKGNMTHEFMIMPHPEGAMNSMSMADMDKLALTAVENITPGQTVTLNYTFPPSTAHSQPEFACYFPGHYMAGMRLAVDVGS